MALGALPRRHRLRICRRAFSPAAGITALACSRRPSCPSGRGMPPLRAIGRHRFRDTGQPNDAVRPPHETGRRKRALLVIGRTPDALARGAVLRPGIAVPVGHHRISTARGRHSGAAGISRERVVALCRRRNVRADHRRAPRRTADGSHRALEGAGALCRRDGADWTSVCRERHSASVDGRRPRLPDAGRHLHRGHERLHG